MYEAMYQAVLHKILYCSWIFDAISTEYQHKNDFSDVEYFLALLYIGT